MRADTERVSCVARRDFVHSNWKKTNRVLFGTVSAPARCKYRYGKGNRLLVILPKFARKVEAFDGKAFSETNERELHHGTVPLLRDIR
jgi:hypothetical protein